MNKSLKIIKEKTIYNLSDNSYSIRVEVSGDGTCFKITPRVGEKDGFIFNLSKPKTIIAIANLLIEATKLK